MPLTDHPALRAALLLLLAGLLIALMLPATRRSRPLRALRTAVKPWLPEKREGARPALLPRRLAGAVIAVLGVACFTFGGAAVAVAGYALAAIGILLYAV